MEILPTEHPLEEHDAVDRLSRLALAVEGGRCCTVKVVKVLKENVAVSSELNPLLRTSNAQLMRFHAADSSITAAPWAPLLKRPAARGSLFFVVDQEGVFR